MIIQRDDIKKKVVPRIKWYLEKDTDLTFYDPIYYREHEQVERDEWVIGWEGKEWAFAFCENHEYELMVEGVIYSLEPINSYELTVTK